MSDQEPTAIAHSNRLALADRFIQAQLAKRPDIIAAWVAGSTARGEETESSDIDVALVIAGDSGETPVARDGVDGWHDGIYYDASYLSASSYADLETVMQNPFTATHMNHALIRYDATGHFTQLQQAVRAVYMEPQWVAKRLHYWLDIARPQVSGLQTAVAASDPLAICQYQGWVSMTLVSIPLLRAGLAPSSTRSLSQLKTVAAPFREQICAFEGSMKLSAADALALDPLLGEWMALIDPAKYGKLGDYFAKKALWMARHGFAQEALHCMFLITGAVAGDCRADEAKVTPATALAHHWLAAIHWTGADVLAGKVALAQSLLADMERLVDKCCIGDESHA